MTIRDGKHRHVSLSNDFLEGILGADAIQHANELADEYYPAGEITDRESFLTGYLGARLTTWIRMHMIKAPDLSQPRA